MTTSTPDPDRPRVGRRCRLTPAVQEKVLVALRAGSYLESAAQLAGIGSSTLYDWLARGRKARSGQFLEFLELVQGAIAQAEVQAVARVNTAAQTDWRAAAWWLERGPARARWRQSVQLGLAELSDAEIQEALNAMAQRLAERGAI